jgi:hypothetical protein
MLNFHEYQPYFDLTFPDLSREQRLAEWQEIAQAAAIGGDPYSASLYLAEAAWVENSRPYYSVYPDFVESLIRLKLDVDCSTIRMPISPLLVRFAVGHELRSDPLVVRSMLVNEVPTKGGHRGLRLSVDAGDTGSCPGLPNAVDFEIRIFALKDGMTVEECLAESAATRLVSSFPRLETKAKATEQSLLPLVKLVCTLCLIGDHPDIITPDVLAKDRAKYDSNPSQEIVDRAHRRGKKGWIIGGDGDVSPHYRRPHFAVRWTEKGRSVPRIVPVKGAIVNRQKIGDVPHGYLEDET